MQYFAYLGGNPKFEGNYINAKMVKAFVPSIEFRQRFGQQGNGMFLAVETPQLTMKGE